MVDVVIDGSVGESGGSMLRTAISYSLLTGKSFKITNIRAKRPKPGLSFQHLTGLNAAHRLSDAYLKGNYLGSTEVTFAPRKINHKQIEIDIGTAGSITLLLQTIILPALFLTKPIKLLIKGGTDVLYSTPIDYVRKILLPQLKKYSDISIQIKKRGYFPKGGGEIFFAAKGKYEQGKNAPKINLTKKGTLLKIGGISHSSIDLQPTSVAERQTKGAIMQAKELNVPVDIQTNYVKTESTGSGIVLWAMFGDKEGLDQLNPIIIGASELGEKTIKAEEVGRKAMQKLIEEINNTGSIDKYLADQLIQVIAITGGEMKTNKISNHILSNIYVAEKFLKTKFTINKEEKLITAKTKFDED